MYLLTGRYVHLLVLREASSLLFTDKSRCLFPGKLPGKLVNVVSDLTAIDLEKKGIYISTLKACHRTYTHTYTYSLLRNLDRNLTAIRFVGSIEGAVFDSIANLRQSNALPIKGSTKELSSVARRYGDAAESFVLAKASRAIPIAVALHLV